MELTLLFLSLLVSTNWTTFYPVLCDSFTRFDHGEFLDGHVCPEGNVTKTTTLTNDIKCLSQCRDQASCFGLFLVQDEMQCVICSARFFYQNISTSSIFYKRNEQVSCRGVFVVPDATQCVTCSARFFYQNKSVTSVISSFYKRNDVQSGSFYLLVRTGLRFYDAKQNCENLGGHLLILNSKEEMDFIYPHLVGTSNIWIGAKGTGGEAYTFEWVDGSMVSNGYSNWRVGQPFPNDNNEKYVNMVKIWNYQWNDEFDGWRQSICEFN